MNLLTILEKYLEFNKNKEKLLIQRGLVVFLFIGAASLTTHTNAMTASIVSTFKRLTNKEINNKIWQRNYYEHIIRNEREYLEIIQYIQNNPLNWNKEKYFM
jgi:REP element-mobilizing transposase RayT